MTTFKFKPEGWNNEITPLNVNNIHHYQEAHDILQGRVKECDHDYNLYINFENGLTGIMPRKEIEAAV